MKNEIQKIMNSIVKVNDKLIIMAGPCTVESRGQILKIAKFVKKQGASVLRGGAWKQRTSPDSFSGLGEEGLKYLNEAGAETGLPIVTEITNPAMVSRYAGQIDMFQVGAKNMQNFDLLTEIGRTKKPVLLKNSPAATYREFVSAADYIRNEGNPNVILCYRGIRTFETMTRYTFDVNAIPILKQLSGLPVVADPSHAAGSSDLVETLACASVIAGADGLLIEVHNDPERALCDGEQSVDYIQFGNLMERVRKVAELVGRSV